MAFKGIIFDMDGTLTVPIIDFQKMRDDLGIPSGDIAKILNSWPEAEQRRGWKIIEEYECSLAEQNRLHPGVVEAFEKFEEQGIRIAILTRNSSRSVEIFLKKFGLKVDMYLSRDFEYIKPAPEPVLHIIEKWGFKPEECIIVGDYIHDIDCGKAAGIYTCFFRNDGHESFEEHAHFCAGTYQELERIVLS
eukprot:TRINITY_DN8042_c0_g2_i1.p2 TRINITY_DN8042_c0_g2~~TRINITY_DN8042_c0_g2_i1.p2  ORF type:complete len:191 (-),score=42.64 TRINITY_DN8042_c0_g2_i1:849-1421(-)